MKDALLKKNKTKLLNFLKVRGQVSVDEATLELKLAKTTVRQHLLLLERQGLISRGVQKASKGRPLLVYRLSENANPLFPTQEPQLLRELLTRLIEDGQSTWLNDFFRKYWRGREQKFEERLKARRKSSIAAHEVLFELLQEEGFMPQITKSRGIVSVRECNCPFPEAVKATQIPCRLEAEFIKNALKTEMRRVTYIPAGSTTCTYVSKKSKPV